MKKIIFASLVASSALLAGDWYVGANVGSSNMKADISAAIKTTGVTGSADYSDDYSETKGGFGIKAGYEMADAHRFEIEYLKIASNTSYAGVGYVYKHSFGDIKPFVGIGIGISSHKEDDVPGMDAFDQSSTSYGLKGGLIYEIAKKHEIELGYSYTMVGNMKQDYTVGGQNIEVKMENMKVGRVSIGYNYRF